MVISEGLKEKLVNEMVEVLEERGYSGNYQVEGVQKIIDTWAERKANIIDLLSNHPKWNPDKLMIQFDEDYSRNFEKDAIIEFCNWLYYEFDVPIGDDRDGYPLQFIKYYIDSQFFDSGMDRVIDTLNDYHPNLRIRNNMKASKAIGKIAKYMGWNKFEGYGKHYSEMCDNINPIKIRRHTCISVNPIDFLLMSNGDTWHSCHDIGWLWSSEKRGPGCYSSGTISYMLDNATFVFYTVDSSYDGDSIEKAKKCQRQIFAYDRGGLFQSRLYPQANDCGAEHIYTEIREVVQKVTADCLDAPNLWKTKSSVRDYVGRGDNATCYADWDNFDVCKISFLSNFAEESLYGCEMTLGTCPLDVFYGEPHCRAGLITGDKCLVWKCAKCGRIHQGDNHVTIDGRLYCRNCVEQCGHCGHWFVKSENESTLVEVNFYNGWTCAVETNTVCSSCAEQYYPWHEHCGWKCLKECAGDKCPHHPDHESYLLREEARRRERGRATCYTCSPISNIRASIIDTRRLTDLAAAVENVDRLNTPTTEPNDPAEGEVLPIIGDVLYTIDGDIWT